MKKSRLVTGIVVIMTVMVVVVVGILVLGHQNRSTGKHDRQTASHAQSASTSQNSDQSESAVSSSTASSQETTTQSESTQQPAENASSNAASSQASEKNDHANLSSRDQPVTISAGDIQATRSILRNAGIDDKKFTDTQIEDLMNQSIATGKPIPDLAR
ncbi:hypothetical protein [Leuconostoc lactis]